MNVTKKTDGNQAGAPAKSQVSRGKTWTARQEDLKGEWFVVDATGVALGRLASSVAKFRHLFADGTCYVAAIPTYVGGHMAMGFASDDPRLRRTPVKTLAARYEKAGRFATKYWTPEVQAAAFALPRFIAEHVRAAKKR